MCNFSNLTMPSLNMGKMFLSEKEYRILSFTFTVNDKVVSCLH